MEQLRAELDKYQQYLASDPGNVNLVAQVADLQFQLGEFDAARQLLQQALAQRGSNPGLMFRLSNIALATGVPEEAVEILKGLQAQGVDNASVQYNLAYAYMYEREFVQAREILERIVSAEDDAVPGAPVLLARCYHHLGDVDKAVELGKAYLEHHPQDQEALGVLSLAAYDSGDEIAAKRWATDAIQYNDSNLEARITLGSMSLSTQDYETAEQHFRRALEKHPDSGRAWSGQGLADMLKLEVDEALDSLNKAVQYMPNHIGTWHALAWCQIIKNDLEGAKASLNKAMDIDRNFGETHGGLAVIAYVQGDKETAKTESRKAILLDPMSFSGRFAESLLTQDTDPEAAQEMITDIMKSSIGADGKSLQEILLGYMRKRNDTPTH